MPRSTKNPVANDTPNPALVLRSGRVIPRMMRNEGHHSKSLTSDQNHGVAEPLFPFLKLPTELRMQIYRYLLHSHCDIRIDETYTSDTPDVLEKRGWQRFTSRWTEREETAFYKVIAVDIHPAILAVNRQIYSETRRIMYSENRFKFYSCLANEAVIPFLESLSEDCRRIIKQIEYEHAVTSWKPMDVGGTEFGTTERIFKENCDYLGQNLQPKHVVLNLVQLFDLWVIKPASKDDLLALHGKTWEQHLVPLVRGLDTFELTARTKDDTEIIDTLSEYLRSKISWTSKPTISTRRYGKPYPS